jgi:hypothetical protein
MAYSFVSSGEVFIVLKIFEIFSAAILVSEQGANYGMGQFDPETAHLSTLTPFPARAESPRLPTKSCDFAIPRWPILDRHALN